MWSRTLPLLVGGLIALLDVLFRVPWQESKHAQNRLLKLEKGDAIMSHRYDEIDQQLNALLEGMSTSLCYMLVGVL
jgi:hypothetical protein